MPVGGTIELSARNIMLAEKEHPRLEKGNYVRISIKDPGIGIPNELLSRIFDPFFTTKAKGHGLGLATCYSIITGMAVVLTLILNRAKAAPSMFTYLHQWNPLHRLQRNRQRSTKEAACL